MPITVEHIYRYPVKGWHGEPLETVELAAGHGVPHDRRFAIARGDTKIDPAAPRWLPKQWFVMLMRDTTLARLSCHLDADAGTIEIHAPDKPPCVAEIGNLTGRERIENYVNDVLGPRREGRAYWVEAGPTSFTDVPQNCLTLINLESVRELEARLDHPLDPQRFRGNLYLRGAAPWAEFDWVGREIQLGDLSLHIPSRIPRCAATHVNPDTGMRDVNIVKELQKAYGHYDMGVYAEVVRGGRIKVGDTVTPPDDPQPRSRIGHWLRFFGFLARSAPDALRRK